MIGDALWVNKAIFRINGNGIHRKNDFTEITKFLCIFEFFLKKVVWEPLNGYFCKYISTEDPDDTPQNVTFHQGLHCLLY